MSKKRLLEESTVRSFMKLANLSPLSDKFLKETWEAKEEGKLEEDSLEESESLEEDSLEESESLEEEELEEERSRSVQFPDKKGPKDRTKEEESKKLEEIELEEEDAGEVTEEGKESESRPKSKRDSVSGVSKPGKMTGVGKGAQKDHTLKPLAQSTKNTGIEKETKKKLNFKAPAKPKGEFQVVSEALEDEDMGAAPEAESPSDAAGETGEHQETVKDAIQKMLSAIQQIANEYGVDMEVENEPESAEAEEGPESGEMSDEAPEMQDQEEDEAMAEQKLEETINLLTKRVAKRLVKLSEQKKRR
jgi:hypothetical protein